MNRGRPPQPGFSLVEVVAVVVILSIMAGLVAPRFVDQGPRRERAEAEAVASLLTAAARRESITGQRLALDFDAKAGRLRMMTFRRGADHGGGEAAWSWQEDPLTPAAELDLLGVHSAETDGLELPRERWRLELLGPSPRPDLVIVLAGGDGQARWTVALASTSDTAGLARPGEAAADLTPSVDLDAAGRRDQPW